MKRYMPDCNHDPALGYAFMEEHPAGSYIEYSDFVKAMDAYHGTPCEQIRHQQALDTLQAKLDAVTKDAERYRWLRESGLEIAWNAQVSYSPGYEAGDAEQMDLAIDAAIDRTRSRHITEHQE